MQKYKLEITVFICGAMIMIMELTASRILAPHFGSSNIVWTSIIGIILISMSIGSYLGGKLADKKPEYKVLATILLMSSLYITVLPSINSSILEINKKIFEDIRIGAVLSTIMLFLVPSILLGTISPFAIKLKMNDLNLAGVTAGKLSAISTLGSIFGTFSAGFVLIPIIGSTNILYLISIGLVLLSIYVYLPKTKVTVIFILLWMFMGVIGYAVTRSENKNIILDTDSEYGRIIVYESKLDNRDVRALNIDSGLESAMFIDNPYELVFDYTEYYDLMNYFKSNIQDTLLIGGAGYSYPKHYLNKYKDRRIEVVEIDPKVTKIAKEYFNLEENDRLRIIHTDGRVYLNENNKKYDVILNDAFKGTTPPFHLSTKEAVEKIYDSLNLEGVYITNIISALEGEKSKILLAQINTLKEKFSNIYVFICDSSLNTNDMQNIIVVASKLDKIKNIEYSEDERINKMLENYREIEINESIIFIDDYAPIDYLMKDLL